MLIGNKCDLSDERKVSIQQATHFAEERECGFFETSALESTNVDQAFQFLSEKIYQKQIEELNLESNINQQKKPETDDGIPIPIIQISNPAPIQTLQQNKQQTNKKKKCC